MSEILVHMGEDEGGRHDTEGRHGHRLASRHLRREDGQVHDLARRSDQPRLRGVGRHEAYRGGRRLATSGH
eukprot:3946036-Heterocapsa_arctica.AAC.1